jgi:hypothetical protein
VFIRRRRMNTPAPTVLSERLPLFVDNSVVSCYDSFSWE